MTIQITKPEVEAIIAGTPVFPVAAVNATRGAPHAKDIVELFRRCGASIWISAVTHLPDDR